MYPSIKLFKSRNIVVLLNFKKEDASGFQSIYWDQPVTQEELPGKSSRQLPSPTHLQCARVSIMGTPPHTLLKKDAGLWLRVY